MVMRRAKRFVSPFVGQPILKMPENLSARFPHGRIQSRRLNWSMAAFIASLPWVCSFDGDRSQCDMSWYFSETKNAEKNKELIQNSFGKRPFCKTVCGNFLCFYRILKDCFEKRSGTIFFFTFFSLSAFWVPKFFAESHFLGGLS